MKKIFKKIIQLKIGKGAHTFKHKTQNIKMADTFKNTCSKREIIRQNVNQKPIDTHQFMK